MFSIENGQLLFKKIRRIIVEKDGQMQIIKVIHEGKAIITFPIIHHHYFLKGAERPFGGNLCEKIICIHP